MFNWVLKQNQLFGPSHSLKLFLPQPFCIPAKRIIQVYTSLRTSQAGGWGCGGWGGCISCDIVSQVERKHLVHSLPEGFSTRVTLIHQGTINEIQIRHQNYTPPSLMRGCHLWRSRQPQLPAVQHLAYEYQLCSGERSVESNASLIVLCNRQPTPSEIY